MRGSFAPAEAVGSELEQETLEDCRKRFADTPGLRFVFINELPPRDNFDAAFCMEVLEHVVDLRAIVDHLANLLAPSV